MNTLMWLVRRECWEHRWLLWAPFALGAAFVALNTSLLVLTLSHGLSLDQSWAARNGFAGHIRPRDMQDVGNAMRAVMLLGVGLYALALGGAVLSYGLACLYDERRDKSVLFWKSLPVSDVQTVLSKTLVALVLVPLLWLAVGLVAVWIAIASYLTGLYLLGLPAGDVLTASGVLARTGLIVLALPMYLLTLLPSVAWLLFCSAWTRRRPFIVAFAVPLLALLANTMGLHNSLWQTLLLNTFPTWFMSSHFALQAMNINFESNPDAPLTLASIYGEILQPNLWIGVVVAVVLLGLATWRRQRHTALV